MRISVLVLLAGLIAPLAAQAQGQQGPVGYWNCEWGFQNTAPGVPADAVGGAFQMIVYPNGGVQGQGYEAGSSGQFQMSFQGGWQFDGRKFMISGQKQGGLAFGASQMQFSTNMTSASTMALTERYQNGQVFASQCQRTG